MERGEKTLIFKIWQEIRKNNLQPIYLLYGNETFLLNETKNLIFQQVFKNESSDFNTSTYDLEETPVEVAVEDCETVPFFAERKIVILKNPIFLTAEKGKEKVEHHLKSLEAYLENPSPTTIAIFLAPYEKLDERKKLTKMLMKTAAVVHAKPLSDNEIVDWIKKQLSEEGKTITDHAVFYLLQLVGPHLQLLKNEINKLILYGEKQIDEKIIESVVSRSVEQNIFVLIDKVVQHKIEDVLSIYFQLLKQNEEPLKILALLAAQFRFMYQVKNLVSKGYSQKQIASMLKSHWYRVKIAAEQAKSFSNEKLIEILSQLADIDYQMKSSNINKERLLEQFFIKNVT